jgi:hypothetical protein
MYPFESGIFPATILMAPSLRIWRVYNRFVYCKSMVYLQDIVLLYIYSFCYLCWKSGIFPGINWLAQYQTAYDIVKTWQCCKCFLLQIKTVLYLYMDSLIQYLYIFLSQLCRPQLPQWYYKRKFGHTLFT